jgi:hypothetical protein
VIREIANKHRDQEASAGWNIWNCTGDNALECRDGLFELPGCDPDKVSTVYFWDRANQRGAAAELSAKNDNDESRVVRLEPCGSAVINCTGIDPRTNKPDGKPLVGYGAPIAFQFDPGDFEPPNTASADRDLEGDWKNTGFQWSTDAEGNGTVSNLIPGMTYSVRTNHKLKNGPKRAYEPLCVTTFSVKAGEKLRVRHMDWRTDPNEKPLPVMRKGRTSIDVQPKANQKLKESFHRSYAAADDTAGGMP